MRGVKMIITFYQNQSAPNVIPKVKTKKFDKTGTLKNNTSITHPTILLKLYMELHYKNILRLRIQRNLKM